jgi:osmotically-inducible protein OsmY
MKKLHYLLSFGLAVGLTAAGQTSSQEQPSSQPQTQTPPVTSTTPTTHIGSGAQTKAGTPATSTNTPNGQVNPSGTAVPPQAGTGDSPSATGGVSGAASSSTGSSANQPAMPEGSANGVAAVTDSDLESQIQNALNKEPTLSGNSPHVKVAADSIQLDGNVNTNKEKLTATRIVQSYAGSRKLVNHLSVGTQGGSANPSRSEPQDQTDRNGASGNSDRTGSGNNNPATNPEPNKGSRPPKK